MMSNKLIKMFCRYNHMLTNKLYAGGQEGRSSFNGRVITIFGSYGNLGTKVVAELGKIGTQLVLPYRCPYIEAQFLKIAGDLGQIHLLEFNPYNYESILKCMEHSDTVINCIGNHSYAPVAKRSNVDVPKMIAHAVANSPNVSKFIHVSCLTQNQKDKDIVSKTKHYGERLVRMECPNAIIVRPSTMYGAPDHFTVTISSRYGYMHLTHMHLMRRVVKRPASMLDVGKAIAKIAMCDKYHGKVFELYSDDEFYLGDINDYITRYIFKSRNMGMYVFLRPVFAVLCRIFKESTYNLAIMPPTFAVSDLPTRDSRLFKFADLDITPTDVEEGIREAVKWAKLNYSRITSCNHTIFYEQPNLRLVPKWVRDKV